MAMERGLSILWIASICGSVQISITSSFLGGPGEGAALTLGERDQQIVDAPVDLEAFAHAARPLAIGALTGNADLVDALLPWRRFDQGDLGGERATVVVQRNEQIGLERDEEVPGALRAGRPATEHAERVHREGERVALVAAEGEERPAPRGRRVRGGAAVLVDRGALRQRDAETL